jgi:outer membrane protein TolC
MYGCMWQAAVLWVIGSALVLIPACQELSDSPNFTTSAGVYRDRMLAEHEEKLSDQRERREVRAVPVSWQSELPERAALVTQPPTAEQPSPVQVLAEMPDPDEAPAVMQQRLETLKESARTDVRVGRNYERVVVEALEELKRLGQGRQVRMSLAECVQRALENNYAIRIEAYNPAISQTHLVEAEAAFDAEFFLDSSWSKQDRNVGSELQASATDTRTYSGGFRKLLASGMQVQAEIGQTRTWSNFQYQTLNPSYESTFMVSFTQPLLRNFGLDVNRATINIRRAERDIAHEKFVQMVRDRLFDVESAYWRLAAARRIAAISAEQVSQNHATYLNMVERQEHDATEVELANSESRWRTRQVEFQEAVKSVRDAEDTLKNLLNDPELLLSEDIEIVPIDTPYAAALALDQLAAVRTAVDRRSEIREALRYIEQARIATAAAKNQTLPQLDLSFQYEVQGMNVSADSSFDNLTTNRFISYAVRAQFSYPIGNRARRAAYRRSQLQESQAVVGLHQTTDAIVQEVNAAVRTLAVRYAQIAPGLIAAQSAERNLRALQARTQRIDPNYLQTELSAVEQLFAARRTLLQVVAEYNIAIAALEKAKGTLLEYNNVVVTDEPPD